MHLRRWTGLAVAAVCLSATITRAQGDAKPALAQPPAPASTARLEIPEPSFNFGYVPQGASISHNFWLKNVGGDTLRITDVRPG